ncbi:MAG: thioredoxin domain-containing protein [Cyclobacteriaceae bacterium]
MNLNLYTRSILLSLFFLGFTACDQSKRKQADFEFTNALIHESSPYLLQHAHNPVDWKAWSQEALEEAKSENKLVLVSIGYSSCHWCHVMEEETFEDKEIAEIMNKNFINIKVDREERPDVDMVYMTALQLMKGNGGWPLNVITLPNGKPIYGGTYHTKDEWAQILTQVRDFYRNDPVKANEYADMVAEGIQEVNQIVPKVDFEKLTDTVLHAQVEKWKPYWDKKWGGEKGDQKFMMPGNLDFLLDYGVLNADEATLHQVKNTLDKMAMGGVYDQIGGGFFRYSTEETWSFPHFEKMLYDNAQLIGLYSKAYKVFKEPLYKEVVMETIDFLDREMKNPDGGYYAAMDADSEGEEGKYYVWKNEELANSLGSEFILFASYFDLDPDRIWENDNHVLFRKTSDKRFLEEHSLTAPELDQLKNKWKEILLTARNKRPEPNKDDKIITSWNALLINGYLEAFTAFDNAEYLRKAEAIFRFIQDNSLKDNQLIHSFKKGGRQVDGFLEDYAFLVNALIRLYSVTMNVEYLDQAKTLHKKAFSLFDDEQSGMFHYNENKDLISKIIRTHDGVLPSPNAVMANNLFLLGHVFYDPEMIKKSKEMISTMLSVMEEDPPSYGRWSALLMQTTKNFYEIAVVGENAGSMLKTLNKAHLPNTLIVGSNSESNLPLFKDRFLKDKSYIYVCQNNTCKLPISSADLVIRQLNKTEDLLQ